MKTARMQSFSQFYPYRGMHDTTRSRLLACIFDVSERFTDPNGITPPEDYAVLIDYALDESLDVYPARINGNDIAIYQDYPSWCESVGTAVLHSDWSELQARKTVDDDRDIDFHGISDWLICFNNLYFHLRVRL
jgi:hypothetical protein